MPALLVNTTISVSPASPWLLSSRPTTTRRASSGTSSRHRCRAQASGSGGGGSGTKGDGYKPGGVRGSWVSDYDLYELLGVERSSPQSEIKAAYRRAARRWHPDACPGGADRFMAPREAYEVLSDPERRRGYDIQLRCGGFGFGDAGYRAARRAGFADWESQLAGLQWRAAERRGRETWGSRMRRAAA